MTGIWTERFENPVSTRLQDPATTGYVGIGFGVVAGLLAIPPIEARSIVWSIVVGIVGAMLGVWTATRGRRRLGVGAVVISLIGLGLGVLATRSSTGNLETVFNASLIAQMFAAATPLVFGAIAGTFSERSGVVNIGLEGMMLMGAFWGVYGADVGGSWVVGCLVGAATGGLLALVLAYFAIQLRADQIVGGTAINFLALGITGYFFFQLYHGNYIPTGVSTIPNVKIPGLSGTSFLGPAIGDLNLLIWGGFLLVIVAHVVIFKTPIGLRIRSCGEHPRAADTVGINVYAIRYGCVILSGVLAALGGVYLSDGFGGGAFNDNMTAGRGFIALAAMIFGNWRPFGAFGAALLFGLSSAVALRLQVYSASASTLFNVLPYVLTLIAVGGVIGRTVAPAADGKPYVRQ
ncbi:MAG TPA: ABC transporter permease [Gaiellaceae bacterium]|nr:ABC transporter permease [Gaiellaceae bacterium]